MSYTFQGTGRVLQAIEDISTAGAPLHPYGTIVTAYDDTYGSGEFIYLKGASSVAVGSWVTYNLDDGSVTLLAANAIGPVAISMSANTSTTSGSWYQISGKAVGLCLASYADNGLVFATSTAGSVDDAVVDGDMVHLAKGASAIGTPSAGFAEFEISRPYNDDITTND
jgi:hypothetical protein